MPAQHRCPPAKVDRSHLRASGHLLQRAARSSPVQALLQHREPCALLAVELGVPALVLLDAEVLSDQQQLGQILFVIPDGYIALKQGGEGGSCSGVETEPAVLCVLPDTRFIF